MPKKLFSNIPSGFISMGDQIVTMRQACKLAPDIGHLSSKFEGFDWRILSLTGHVDWALPL